jgi:hypothetical protein
MKLTFEVLIEIVKCLLPEIKTEPYTREILDATWAIPPDIEGEITTSCVLFLFPGFILWL